MRSEVVTGMLPDQKIPVVAAYLIDCAIAIEQVRLVFVPPCLADHIAGVVREARLNRDALTG
jgi:hypothetical protein